MDQIITAFQLGNIKEINQKIDEFIVKWSKVFDIQQPLDKKKQLINHLFRYLRNPSYSTYHHVFLSCLRILTRDKNDLEDLFTIDRIETILHLARLVGEEEAFMTDNSEDFDARVVIEAQKCICNLVFNGQIIRRICCNNSCVDGIMLRLRMYKDPHLPVDVKYFDMRILFIITALNAEIRPKIRDDYHGIIYLMEAIDLILKEAQEPGQKPTKKSQRRRREKEKEKENKEEKKEKKEEEVEEKEELDKKEKEKKQEKEIKEEKKMEKEVQNQTKNRDETKDEMTHYLDNPLVDLCCEVLKVLFNLTISYERESLDEVEEAHFLRLVGILHDLLLTDTKDKDKRDCLQNHTVNLLTNIPPSCFDELLVPIEEIGKIGNPKYEYEDMNVETIAVLIEFLDRRLDKVGSFFAKNLSLTYFLLKPSKSLNESLAPILTCLNNFARVNRIIRKYLRSQILPPLKDVMSRPEEGSTLRNKLVKLMTAPNTDVKEMVADLLFVLCKENIQRLIKYTGYGNSAGLLANRGLMLGGKGRSNYSSESEDSDTDEYLKYKDRINPVTGCYEDPKPNPMANMTEEQKEYEAMQLVNMMGKLSRNGIVQPCKVGENGRPHPISHVLELQQDAKIKKDDSEGSVDSD